MTRQSLFMACALTLSVMGIASAKSYDVSFDKTTKVGATDLKPGTYSVKLVNGQAVFTREAKGSEVYPMDGETYGKPITVPVTVQHAGKKFSETAVESANTGDSANLHEIDLGGTDTKLVFGQ